MKSMPRKPQKLLILFLISVVLITALLPIILLMNANAKPTATAIPGLILYYPFNGNANDESGNGIDGEVLGASLAADRFGKPNSAYYFDGVDDSIIFDAAKMPAGSSPRTISAWIKAESYPPPAPQLPQIGSRATIIGWGKDDILKLSAMEIVNKKLTYHVYNWDTIARQDVEVNQWYHLVIVHSGQKTILYINGTAEEYESRVLETDTLRGRIGAFPDQTVKGTLFPDGYDMSYFHGIIDDLCIYNQALTLDQVRMLYDDKS